MVVNFLGLVGVRLPLALLLAWPEVALPGGVGSIPAAGWGAVGAWCAMAADLTARGLAMLVIFTRVRWTRVAV
jgi:Na+-driven multidrug efflux pump